MPGTTNFRKNSNIFSQNFDNFLKEEVKKKAPSLSRRIGHDLFHIIHSI
jgi:hypothetical protein